MKRLSLTASILALALCYGSALWADTTITYQGRLDSGGQPHSGTVGMVFELYDQANGGSQQGPTLNESVQVTDGLFQAELDFGAQSYEEGRWLQITVNGQLLSPRQRITGAPFALRTQSAGETGYTTVYFTDFQPREEDTEFTAGNQDYLWCPATSSGICQGNAHFSALPHGARLDNIRFWFYDNDDESSLTYLQMMFVEVCHPDASGGDSEVTILASVLSEGAPGYDSVAVDIEGDVIVDTRRCLYRTHFFPGIGGSQWNLGFQKARVQWTMPAGQ